MKAVILAAGKGSRISEVTNSIPKPMINYKGKPILEHNIELCKRYGVRDIFINTSHLASKIKEYFGSGRDRGVTIQYSFEEYLLGTASALVNFKSYLVDEPFYVIYGDNYSNYDLKLLSIMADSEDCMAVIGFHYREDISSSGVAEFDSKGRVLKFIEKPTAGETNSHWANAGIYLLNPAIFDAVPNKYSDFGRDVFPMLLRNNIPIYGVCEDADVRAFDTPDMLSQNTAKNDDTKK